MATIPKLSDVNFLPQMVTKPIPSLQELTAEYGDAGYAAILQKVLQDQQNSYKEELSQTTAPSNTTLSSLGAPTPAPVITPAPVVATTSTIPKISDINALGSYVTKPIPSLQELTAEYGDAGYAAILQKVLQDQQNSYKEELSQTTAPSNTTLSSLGAPTSQISGLPTSQISGLPTSQISTVPNGSITALTTADLASWGKTLPQGITNDQLSAALKSQQDASTKSYTDALAANQTALSKQNSDFLTNWNSSAATLKNDILAGVDAKNQAFGTEATKGFMGAFKNFQIPTNQQTGVNMGNYNDNRNAAADQWWSQYVTGRR